MALEVYEGLLGCLHRCLTTDQHYDETVAFPSPPKNFPTQLDNLTASDVFDGRLTAGRK